MGLFSWIGKKKAPKETLPIPTHLQSILIPVGSNNNECEVTGTIKCHCGSDAFEICENNERQLLKIVCKECKKEFVLFDSGKHGWNGFVCKDDFLDREIPLEKVCCSKCGESSFKIALHISSQGKEDFAEECLANDDSFSQEDWVNAFEWITVSLSCIKCGHCEKNWLDFETM